MNQSKISLYGLGLALLAGCASTSLPAERMANSEAAIRGAQEVGAEKNPRASLYLKLAQDEVESAKKMINAGDNHRADLMLQRAKADAELALTLSRQEASKTEAQQALEQVQTLKQPQQSL